MYVYLLTHFSFMRGPSGSNSPPLRVRGRGGVAYLNHSRITSSRGRWQREEGTEVNESAFIYLLETLETC
jgi:hypothetical protein